MRCASAKACSFAGRHKSHQFTRISRVSLASGVCVSCDSDRRGAKKGQQRQPFKSESVKHTQVSNWQDIFEAPRVHNSRHVVVVMPKAARESQPLTRLTRVSYGEDRLCCSQCMSRTNPATSMYHTQGRVSGGITHHYRS